MKRCLSLFLTVLLTLPFACAAPAPPANLSAKSAALYAAGGQELFAYQGDLPLQPASVTKIMTMLLAMEAVERGDVSFDTMITGSDYACSMGGTQIWLEPGEQLSLSDMLKAIAVGSANDCAVAVAEHLAGTEDAFVAQMNERAAELGCTGTKFINANGLDGIGEKTMTTARDIARISCALLEHPKILDYTGIWMDSIRDGKFALANTNKMLKKYPGLTGLKTGYISEAGFCISASATRDNLTLVAVVMAAPTKEARMADATALLDYGFASFAQYTPVLDPLPDVPVTLGRAPSVSVTCAPTQGVLIPKGTTAPETSLLLPDSLQAPIAQGQQVGVARITLEGQTLLEVPLLAAQAVERQTLGDLFRAFPRALTGDFVRTKTPPPTPHEQEIASVRLT